MQSLPVRPVSAASEGAGAIGGAIEPAAPRGGTAGRGSVIARRERDATVLSRVQASSPLRFLRPTFPGSSAAAVCLVTFGGGLVDGDSIDLDLTVEPGATLVVFTQSTTKAFRGSSRQSITAVVRDGGTLVLLPDPIACFRSARYVQRVDVSLHGTGSLVALDGFTAGRAAFGDRWAFDALELATTVRLEGHIVVRDAVRLHRSEHAIAPRMDRFDAFLTLLAVGPRVAPVAESMLAPSVVAGHVVAAPSPLPAAGGAIVRVAATSAAHAVAEARSRLRNLPDIDVVDPFASRY